VHIYSIDVAGLDKGVGSSGLITAEDEFSLAGLNARMRSGEPDAEDVLTSLALDTGGLLFLNRNFYGETLKQIDEDSSNYYVLAFRPEDKGKAKKGAYRALHIKVNRPRVTVRARKGYVVQ
jgi:VWFA-related protein